uniref:rRNA methyltransferase 1, mitochondrial n=1 Tax=Crassostrea virginica TaxID=6565 RepID=A0A8B8E8P4_CRAVI|nr:rRNA methyltransferase 1, mitochondrial-like [Crassostrea virginica]
MPLNIPQSVQRRMLNRTFLIKGLELKTVCKLYSSYNGTPEYNHRLTGQGKKSEKFFKEHRVEVEVREEVLFGIHPVSLALQAHKRTLHRLYVKQNTEFGGEGRGVMEQADKLGIPVQWVTKQALNQLSGSRPNQGVCMDVSKLHIPTASSHICWTEMKSKWKYPVWLMPYNVQDPMNFGAILRTAFFLGVDQVLIPHNSCPPTPVVSKASSGALEVMEGLTRLPEEGIVIETLKNWRAGGGEVVAACLESQENIPIMPLREFSVTKPVFMVVGNEERGISEAVMLQCNQAVYIPGNNTRCVGSLNVSVATAILIHHVVSNNDKISS